MKSKRTIKVQKATPCKGNKDGSFYIDIQIGDQHIYNMTAPEAIELMQKIEEKL